MTRAPRLPSVLARALLLRRPTQNAITVLGIAVGVMVLITALSLTNGFGQALIDATLRATPQLTLTAWTSTGRDPKLEAALSRDPNVRAFAPFLADKGLLSRPAGNGRTAGVDFATLFGVPPAQAQVLQLGPAETQALATLPPGQILLGGALAQSIGAFKGDGLRLLNAQQRRVELQVAGTFNTGNYLIDSGYAFVRLETLQALDGGSRISGYQVRLLDPDQAPATGQALVAGHDYSSTPWQNLNRTLLDQLALQKRVIGIVVSLIVMVAAFGIANVLTLTVFEKTQDIAILRAIGASGRDITLSFMAQGLLLGLAGLVLGDLLGLALSAYFVLHPFQLPGDLYYISALPVQIRVGDVLWVNAVGLTTTLLAAYLPTRRAAAIEPARMIR